MNLSDALNRPVSMEEDLDHNQLFACSICSKKCGNKKSQLRHISYCRRTKSRGLDRSRKKACLICTKAKTHCDLVHPSCSRCLSKGLSCNYERSRISQSTGPQSHGPPEEITGQDSSSTSTLDLISQQANLPSEGNPPHTSIVHSTASPYENVYSSGEWDFALTGNNSGPLHAHQSRPITRYSYHDTAPPQKITNLDIMKALIFPEFTTKALKAFWPRRARDNQSSLNKAFVTSALRSYPSMLLLGKCQPPFIHAQCLTNGLLPTPLATCAAIVQMMSVRNESNAVFIWKAIRMEQERLSTECDEYDDETTVAALQAVTIYIILRLFEKNEEATNFDIPLIYTMIKLGIKTNGFCMTYGNTLHDGIPTWKGWMLAESLRRSITVLLLVDLLYDISSSLPSYKCDGTVLPRTELPCSRDLWRASSEAEWRTEYIARGNTMGEGNELTYSDLLNYRFRADGRERRDGTDKRIEEWLAQLDDFGMLVMSAASLPVFH